MLSLFRIAALVVALTAVQPAYAGDVVDRIVAQVNGEIVTLFELNEQMKPLLDRLQGRQLSDNDKLALVEARKQILNKMVDEILIRQQVEKLGITVTDTEILNELEATQKRNKLSGEDFEARLRLEGMTLDEYKDKLRNEILKHRLLGVMVKRKVVVSDEEVRQYFEDHKDRFGKARKVELGVILVPSDQQAAKLRQEIVDGDTTFAQAAAKYSQGPGKDQGGNIGHVEWDSLAPEWRDALEGVEPGGVSEPFDLNGMGAILQLVSEDSGEEREFDEKLEAKVRAELFQQQLDERFKEYMQDLRSQAVVEIKL